MKYNYRHIIDAKMEHKVTQIIELPTNVMIKSILVETNLPKGTVIELIKNGFDVLLSIPIHFLKNFWFPLDFEDRDCRELTLRVKNNTNKERYIKVYLAQEEA